MNARVGWLCISIFCLPLAARAGTGSQPVCQGAYPAGARPSPNVANRPLVDALIAFVAARPDLTQLADVRAALLELRGPVTKLNAEARDLIVALRSADLSPPGRIAIFALLRESVWKGAPSLTAYTVDVWINDALNTLARERAARFHEP